MEAEKVNMICLYEQTPEGPKSCYGDIHEIIKALDVEREEDFTKLDSGVEQLLRIYKVLPPKERRSLTKFISALIHQTARIAAERAAYDTAAHLRADIQAVRTTVDRRKDFAEWVRAALAYIISSRFSCRCPLTDTIITTADGRPNEQFQLHHWQGKGGCNPKYAFAVSRHGHEYIEANANLEREVQANYEIQQRALTELVKTKGKQSNYCESSKPLFPDLS